MRTVLPPGHALGNRREIVGHSLVDGPHGSGGHRQHRVAGAIHPNPPDAALALAALSCIEAVNLVAGGRVLVLVPDAADTLDTKVSRVDRDGSA